MPDAQVLEEITYAEAAELAYNGAKVLHPRTLAPLVEKKIPVLAEDTSESLAARFWTRLEQSRNRGAYWEAGFAEGGGLVAGEP